MTDTNRLRRLPACLAALALAAACLLAAGNSSALAQGSAGGTIGKRGKSASGEEAAAPARRLTPREEPRTAPPAAERSRRKTAVSNAAAPAPSGCGRAVGSWLWYNQAIVAIKQGGTFSVGALPGTWRCDGDVIVLNGPFWVDRMRLSSDGNSLSGTDTLGLAISGRRM